MRHIALLGVVAVAFFVPGAHALAQGCNANLAWQDRFPAWSPTGNAIAFMRQQRGCSPPPESVGIVRPGSPEEIIGADGRRGSTAPPSWSDNGLAVAFGTLRSTIGVDAPGGRVGDDGPGEFPSWAGDNIAFTIENEVRILELISEARRTLLVGYAKPTQSNGMPVWSPDRRELALGVMLNAAEGGIAVLKADGSGARVIARGANQSVNPTWSPDGSTIAFESNRDGDFEIYSVRTDGTDLRNLTRSRESEDRFPAWSGNTIAFISNRDRKSGDLYGFSLFTISPDGSNLRWHAQDLHPHSPLAWSPDGSQIAFASGRECLRWGIYVFDRRTDGTRRITNRCTFNGSSGDDIMRGTPFRDFLYGGDGRDRIFGLAGPDLLRGDLRKDHLDGGPGPDILFGGRSDDVVVGGDGNDRIVTDDRGHDRVFGGKGNDLIESGSGSRDLVSCGPGRDAVFADRRDRIARDCERVRRN